MDVFASSKYNPGSISIYAERNGVPYEVEGYSYWKFAEYGTYKLIVSAKLNDVDLTKQIYFTIVNVKEARTTFDLTGLMGYKIKAVYNDSGKEITTGFKTLLNQNTKGMFISYENAIAYENDPENIHKLGITSGKTTFTIVYEIENGIYPRREISSSFTLNDENPTIQCTLEKGESTKKKFEIFFNPAIIFEQIGESYIYINDEIVAVINESSANDEIRIAKSFKKNGDGDYYVKLVSSSGYVFDSYKVTIKEPLNVMSIIIIIVVVAVVATVTITIILLRRKMRIR